MPNRFFTVLPLLCLLLSPYAMAQSVDVRPVDPENTLYLYIDYMDGEPSDRVTIQLRPDLAPRHVARVKELVRQGFYDGLVFHRVVEGFVAQAGDPDWPKDPGAGGSGQNIEAEFQPGQRLHTAGALSMARTTNINSADSQFFIVLETSENNHDLLDGQYTYFGHVIDGLASVQRIAQGAPQADGAVMYPDRIHRMTVMADEQALAASQ